jgi:hypothetical protein
MGPGLLLAAAILSGVVVKPVANMYSGPSEDKDVVSQSIYSSNVTVLEKKGHWFKIRTADDYSGWTRSSGVRVLKPQDKPYAARVPVTEVRSLFAHLYREASVTKHQPVLTVPFETRLEVLAEPDKGDARWLQVRTPDGKLLWVQRGDVQLDPPKLSIPEMIELANRFMGLPYTWGGTSSYGYDCSGFMQMLCRRRGILLPRDAGPQAHWEGVRPVERADLIAGDLLYFGSSMEKITHTGMYIGDGQFIHATTNEHPVVQISRLDEPRWTKLFVCARRPK